MNGSSNTCLNNVGKKELCETIWVGFFVCWGFLREALLRTQYEPSVQEERKVESSGLRNEHVKRVWAPLDLSCAGSLSAPVPVPTEAKRPARRMTFTVQS